MNQVHDPLYSKINSIFQPITRETFTWEHHPKEKKKKVNHMRTMHYSNPCGDMEHSCHMIEFVALLILEIQN